MSVDRYQVNHHHTSLNNRKSSVHIFKAVCRGEIQEVLVHKCFLHRAVNIVETFWKKLLILLYSFQLL